MMRDKGGNMGVNKAISEIIGVAVDFENDSNFLKLQEFLFNEFGGLDSMTKKGDETYRDCFLNYFHSALVLIQNESGFEGLNKFRKNFVRVNWE